MVKVAKSIIRIVGVLFCILFAYICYSWLTAPYYGIAGIPVLNYHQVNDKNYSPLTVTVKHFDQQMDYLVNCGYHTITMDDLYNYLENGSELPDKPVLITFDDGYVDNYREALPILKSHNMKATLFMIGDSIGQKRFVNEAQLKEMEASGFAIEAHTYTHRNLTKLTPEEVREELIASRDVLEKLLGKKVRYLAYPGGFNNDQIVTIAQEEGYRLAFTVQAGNVSDDDNRYRLPRLAVFEGDNAFLSMVIRLHLSELVGELWHMRDVLKAQGYILLAQWVPLF